MFGFIARVFRFLFQGISVATLIAWLFWLGYLFVNGIDDDGSNEELFAFLITFVGPPFLSIFFWWLSSFLDDF